MGPNLPDRRGTRRYASADMRQKETRHEEDASKHAVARMASQPECYYGHPRDDYGHWPTRESRRTRRAKQKVESGDI